MNAEMNAVPGQAAEAAPDSVTKNSTRPFYWSVRRELWENRSLYLAPLVAAVVVLVSFLLNALHLSDGVRVMSSLDPARQRGLLISLYSSAAMLIMLTTLIVAWFYCLDALHSERRDRSILFWKSLPVSDLETVLSKVAIPTLVLPLITFVVVAATQLLILIVSTVILLANGFSAALPWTQLPMLEMWLVLLYSLIVLTVWYAPIYAWLLFVSAWARRSTFLWAVMPPLAICMVEAIALHSNSVWSLLKYRLTGGFSQAFAMRSGGGHYVVDDNVGVSRSLSMSMPEHLSDLLDPMKFLSSPAVWIGLAVAAGLIAATIWLRRYREPI